MELISVVITTCKRSPDVVIRAISSIITQTYKNIEIIVVDDSPPQYSERSAVNKAVEDLSGRAPHIEIRYIPHESNQGACVARNTGMNAARGEYIAYLDDDDEWLPSKLEKQYEVMKASGAALVYCGCICVNDDTGVYNKEMVEYHRGNVFYQLLFKNFIASTSFPLIKINCLKTIGGFDPLMQSAQDYDVWLRIAEKNMIDYVEEALVIYHEHSDERITTNPIKKVNGLERINSKYEAYLNNDPALWRQRNIVLTPYYSMAGDKKKAVSVWLQCCIKKPFKVVDNIKYLVRILR